MSPFRKTTLVLLGLLMLGAAPAAFAQSAAIDQTCLVGGQQGTGVAQVATSCPIGRAPALQAFRFGFFNGNHRIRHIELMPNGETFEAAYEDVGGEDPWFIEGRWLRVPEAQGGVVTAVVQGIADIPIPAGPPNTTLVLSGFEFKRADGTDNNIRTIGVTMDTAHHAIRTIFLDDQGADFSNLPAAIAVGFAFGATGVPDPNMSFGAAGVAQSLFQRGTQRLTPGVPFYESIPAETPPAPAASGGSSTGGLILRPGVVPIRPGVLNVAPAQVKVSDTHARAYQVRIAYLWVPNAHLTGTRQVSSGGRALTEVSGRLPAGAHVIQSFALSFMNSDHFLEGFGVHLRGGGPFRRNVSQGEAITYNDDNRDDPIQWTVRFSDFH